MKKFLKQALFSVMTVVMTLGTVIGLGGGDASAYNTWGSGRMTTKPSVANYWNGYSNTWPNIDTPKAIRDGIYSWNDRSTEVNITATAYETSAEIRFKGGIDDTYTLGETFFYDRGIHFDPTVSTTTNWTYTIINRNYYQSTYNKPSEVYSNINHYQYLFQAMIAHETGHAFGIAHEGNYYWTEDQLMHPDTDAWVNEGVYVPDSDAIAGINAMY